MKAGYVRVSTREQDEGNAQTETARFDHKKPRTGRFHDGNRLPVLLNGGAHLTRTANKSASFGTSAWLHDDCLEARL